MKKQKSTRTPRPRPATVPPLVAALIRFTDPRIEGLTDTFVQAYAAMPRLIAATVDGNEDDRYNLIRDLSGLTKMNDVVDERGIDYILASVNSRGDEGFLRAVALLEKDDPDLAHHLITPIMDAAFEVGFAFAAHLLTEGGRR